MLFGLGIDTGGTYTDSVVIDMETNEIVRRSKALTTRDDLIVGKYDEYVPEALLMQAFAADRLDSDFGLDGKN